MPSALLLSRLPFFSEREKRRRRKRTQTFPYINSHQYSLRNFYRKSVPPFFLIRFFNKNRSIYKQGSHIKPHQALQSQFSKKCPIIHATFLKNFMPDLQPWAQISENMNYEARLGKMNTIIF
jgi:hypothetical protein